MRVNTIQNNTSYKPLQFKAKIRITNDAQQITRLADNNDFNILRQLCEAFKDDKTEYLIDTNAFKTSFLLSRGTTLIKDHMAIGFIRDALLHDLISRNTTENVNSAYKTLVDTAYANKLKYLQDQRTKIQEEIDLVEKQKEQSMNHIKIGNQESNISDFLFKMRNHSSFINCSNS